jgi:hypothetical protein
MPVVINEFEIVPAESQQRPAAQAGGSPESAQGGDKPRDPQRELDKGLRKRARRATRLMAV